MRENQRGGFENISSGTQKGRNKIEKTGEPIHCQDQQSNANVSANINGLNSEGMIYLDIIPRFAL
ncbi:MAG: hypothetical protein WCF67_25595 [Chitinophagaceae bacterium]